LNNTLAQSPGEVWPGPAWVQYTRSQRLWQWCAWVIFVESRVRITSPSSQCRVRVI